MARSRYLVSQFNADRRYPCPVCWRGEIATMPLMDTLGCNFCNHIFIFEPPQQTLKMADSNASLVWEWNGNTWQNANRQLAELSWGLGLAGIALVVFPTTIMALSAYAFAPEPDVSLAWVPLVWTILTFICHLYFVLAIAADYYQFPLLSYLRIIKRSLMRTSHIRN
ncbi:hypothetical protein V2H45_01765 [Tumidithrix elongata RA019]|uniref:DUF983 domain-containing protein n=2 Tax=Tumidithrix TaxID=3088355 RepID=A0AAW9PT62_9CYAN|nr:hypothetical protein [Tumidithrix elongata RA019]